MEAHGFISNTLNCCRYDVVSNVTTKVKDKKLTMRILIVNTSESTGGAAVAANRLMEALKNNGVKAKMLVVNKTSDQLTVVGLSHQWLQRWRFLWERFTVFCHLHFSKNNLYRYRQHGSRHNVAARVSRGRPHSPVVDKPGHAVAQ